jgi:hypothetical protein
MCECWASYLIFLSFNFCISKFGVRAGGIVQCEVLAQHAWGPGFNSYTMKGKGDRREKENRRKERRQGKGRGEERRKDWRER